jgi:hypothetical protein
MHMDKDGGDGRAQGLKEKDLDKQIRVMFNLFCLLLSFLAAVIFSKAMIAHDKGKPAAGQGRKAVSLRA